LPGDKFSRGFEQVTPCTSAGQTGCIVSYDAYGQDDQLVVTVPHWYKSGWESRQLEDGSIKSSLCVNPLSWTNTLDKVSKKNHLGAMPVEFKRTPVNMLLANNSGFISQALPALTSELTWAQCKEDVRLEIMQQTDNVFSNHIDQPNKSYHILDFSLFYGNIRQNTIRRII
jgi:hypothetical protein